jgi:opacity protein-like surface antigen
MVKIAFTLVVLLFLALPVMAQDEYPRIEMAMGYANLAFPCCGGTLGDTGHHSGFFTTQGFNLNKSMGIENYFGYYSLGGKDNPQIGSSVSILTNMIGGKLAKRTDRFTPYVSGGIGFGYLTNNYSFGQSSFGTRIGPGVDIRLNDSMAWKVDVTRFSFHQQFTAAGGSWSSGWNIATGIVFTLSN